MNALFSHSVSWWTVAKFAGETFRFTFIARCHFRCHVQYMKKLLIVSPSQCKLVIVSCSMSNVISWHGAQPAASASFLPTLRNEFIVKMIYLSSPSTCARWKVCTQSSRTCRTQQALFTWRKRMRKLVDESKRSRKRSNLSVFWEDSHFNIALMGVFDISFRVSMMMFKMFAMVPKIQIWKYSRETLRGEAKSLGQGGEGEHHVCRFEACWHCNSSDLISFEMLSRKPW